MTDLLVSYLAEVERGLKGLSMGRRRLFLRELEAHLRDEMEARGISDEAGLRGLLAEKEPPELLAHEIAQGEDGDAMHRSETALLAGALLGLATGSYLCLQVDWPWFLGLAFGTAHGLAVGTGIFLARPRWQRLGPRLRLLATILFGTFLSIPLGFTSLHGFLPTRLIYGAFTAYLVERHAQARPPWQAILETLALTGLDFCQVALMLHRLPCHYQWVLEMSFNFTLAFTVLGVLHLRRALSGRWLLAAENER